MLSSRLAALPMALVLLAVVACGPSDIDRRQAEVAEAGRSVMPFDLDATTHVFERLDDGGLQTVMSDTDAPEQVALVRAHLAEEAGRFRRGDFHDPGMIHGQDMPGLHALMTSAGRITIEYREVDRGAEIRYRSDDPTLVAAIHDWFDAQLSDHGAHAQPTH